MKAQLIIKVELLTLLITSVSCQQNRVPRVEHSDYGTFPLNQIDKSRWVQDGGYQPSASIYNNYVVGWYKGSDSAIEYYVHSKVKDSLIPIELVSTMLRFNEHTIIFDFEKYNSNVRLDTNYKQFDLSKVSHVTLRNKRTKAVTFLTERKQIDSFTRVWHNQ